jgi:hypothetical protein
MAGFKQILIEKEWRNPIIEAENHPVTQGGRPLMPKIKITIGGVEFDAELNQSATAREIGNKLPILGKGSFWGEEIYFSIPVNAAPENPQEIVEPGTLAYWPPGKALCIFWGPTPVSHGNECRPASPVNVVGKITSDLAPLKKLRKADVKVEEAL